MITIPDNAAPADVVGQTDILAGQDWLVKETLVQFANWIQRGNFPWEAMQQVEPMAFQRGSAGLVISQGHHRWVAARLAGVDIPVEIEVLDDYWPGIIPYAHTWDQGGLEG